MQPHFDLCTKTIKYLRIGTPYDMSGLPPLPALFHLPYLLHIFAGNVHNTLHGMLTSWQHLPRCRLPRFWNLYFRHATWYLKNALGINKTESGPRARLARNSWKWHVSVSIIDCQGGSNAGVKNLHSVHWRMINEQAYVEGSRQVEFFHKAGNDD